MGSEGSGAKALSSDAAADEHADGEDGPPRPADDAQDPLDDVADDLDGGGVGAVPGSVKESKHVEHDQQVGRWRMGSEGGL